MFDEDYLRHILSYSLLVVCLFPSFRQNDTDKMCRRLANLKLEKGTQAKQKFTHDGFLGVVGRRVDLLDHYEKKLENLEINVRMEQTSLTRKV